MADATVHSEDRTPKALDVPTTNYKDLVKPRSDGYYEDEEYRPDPLAQYGTLDTSDTAGGVHQDIREVSPVFGEARARNLVTAAKALDPEDPTPAELVVLPQGSVTVTGSVRSPEEAREEIALGIRKAADEPLILGGPTAGQQAAAQEDEEADDRKAEREASLDRGQPSNTATTTESGARADARTRAAAQRKS